MQGLEGTAVLVSRAENHVEKTGAANSVRKRHFLLSWSIRPRQASKPAGGPIDLEQLGRTTTQGVEGTARRWSVERS